MNMKGGYSTEDYESLMDQYILGEIEPFLNNFINAIKEYRTNYTSKNSANQTRAKVINKLLNKFKDDDTGQYLGDLLLNETKYEIGDDAYNNLSDSEKNNTADLVTIFAQANGYATLLIENLITRGSDTNDSTWIDRFSVTTYDDLVDDTGKTPTDAKNELAQQYDDDANTIVDEMWDDFKEALEGYDDVVDYVNSYDYSAYKNAVEAYNNMDENASEDEKDEITETLSEELENYYEYISDLELIAVYELLSQTDYDDGTLLDFFLQDTSSDDFDITCVYPIVASLTDGQRSGLDFVSLRELCCMAITDEDGYNDIDTDSIPESSIYDGVDRDIYDSSGVAVTSDAQRTDALSKMQEESSKLSDSTIVLWCVTGSLAVAAVVCGVASALIPSTVVTVTETVLEEVSGFVISGSEGGHQVVELIETAVEKEVSVSSTASQVCSGLCAGLSVAVIIMAAISIWQTYSDLKEYYNVTFTPQPRYIVEEEDITGYNKKGEKIVIKNQGAYYKIVETNRDSSAEFYETLGTGNDLNGDVGQQWLTLYAVRTEGNDPILASSLKTVVKSTETPSGYSSGIHMFGEDTAYNLNNTNFVWDEDAPTVYVYYKTDDSGASESGSVFSMGHLALVGGICLIVGAGLTAIIMTVVRKRKEKKAAVTA